LVGPSTLVPRDFEKLGVKVSYKIEDVLPNADVVNLLRIQHERQRREYFPGLGEYIRLFGLTKQRAKLLKPECLIMHPGPINRGVEIDSEIADGLQSVILDQVTNGLAVRMAVFFLCGGIASVERWHAQLRGTPPSFGTVVWSIRRITGMKLLIFTSPTEKSWALNPKFEVRNPRLKKLTPVG